MSERVTIAGPRRASLVLAHLVSIVWIVAVGSLVGDRAFVLEALPLLAALVALVLHFDLRGMAGSISSAVDLESKLETPVGMWQSDGEVTVGRVQPLFFWERSAAEAEATETLRRFLGSRVVER